MPSRPFVTKAVRNGNALTLTIPMTIRRAKGYKVGDYFGITVVEGSIVYTKLSDTENVEVAGAAAADVAQRLKFDDDHKAIA